METRIDDVTAPSLVEAIRAIAIGRQGMTVVDRDGEPRYAGSVLVCEMEDGGRKLAMAIDHGGAFSVRKRRNRLAAIRHIFPNVESSSRELFYSQYSALAWVIRQGWGNEFLQWCANAEHRANSPQTTVA